MQLAHPAPASTAGAAPRRLRRPHESRYILRKLFSALLTIVAIVVLNFFLFRLMPGSPERA